MVTNCYLRLHVSRTGPLPTIGRELRFPEADRQWLVTAYGLTFAGFLLLGGGGVALFVVFLVVETRVPAPLLPLLPLRLFRVGSVAGSNAVGFLLGTSFLTFVFVGTLYMQQVLGFSALATGAAWMTASVTSLACANLSQRLVTKTSPRLVMVLGMALIGAGMLWAALCLPNQAWLGRH